MKHLLRAAVIATSFALPVKAETYVVNCKAEDPRDNITLEIDATNQTLRTPSRGFFDEAFLLNTTIWNDDYIGFLATKMSDPLLNDIQANALLNRNNGQMGVTSVQFVDGQPVFDHILFHCTRPI